MAENPHPEPPDQPLGLTVHSLPQPSEVAQAEEQRTRNGRWRMLWVLLVCAAPVVASYVTYYLIRPQNQKSYGELIQPTRSLPDVTATDLAQHVSPLAALKNQWLLISVSSGACDDSCQERLYLQRQIVTGLGRERDRVDWVWLINDQEQVPAAIQPGLKEAVVLRVPPDALNAWLQAQAGQNLSDHLYLVDPMGHWMMRFPYPQDAKVVAGMKRDLERLMRAASSWDKPGR